MSKIKFNDEAFRLLFDRFLKEKNLEKAYKQNCKDQETLVGYKLYILPDRFLRDAFSWENSNEGVFFWEIVNRQWLKFMVDEEKNGNLIEFLIPLVLTVIALLFLILYQ